MTALSARVLLFALAAAAATAVAASNGVSASLLRASSARVVRFDERSGTSKFATNIERYGSREEENVNKCKCEFGIEWKRERESPSLCLCVWKKKK